MTRDDYLRIVRGEARGPLAAAARAGLSVASWGYAIGVRYRNRRFDRDPSRSVAAEVPVVSIGNITLGGTGKTPMVEYVARHFRQRDLRVAILSRGYGSTGGLNDEGLVLEENLPDVPHLQGVDRASLAAIACSELESEVLVLDDGFQHRRLKRDLDIVLLDALDPFGLGRLFPRGLLREPPSSLARAGVVVLSRADLVAADVRSQLRERVRALAPRAAWAEARHAPLDLLDSHGQSDPLSRASEGPVVAFCGLGNPTGFRRTLEQLGVPLADFRAFPDHHAYALPEIGDLSRWAESHSARLVLTTQKDSVKLRLDALGSVPLRALRIGLELIEGGESLDAALDRVAPSP